MKQAVQPAGRKAHRDTAREAKYEGEVFLFTHVSLDVKEATNISDANRMKLLHGLTALSLWI